MSNWLKYMKQEELQELQFNLSQDPWKPPTRDQVDRMLKEIRTAQTERSKMTSGTATKVQDQKGQA